MDIKDLSEKLNTLRGWIQTNANNTAELVERIDELSRQGSAGGAIVESAQPRQRISLTTSGNDLQLIINDELVSTVDLSEYLDDINIQTVSFDDATDTLTITETDGQIHNVIVSGYPQAVISDIDQQMNQSTTTTVTVTGDFITTDVDVQVPGLTVSNVTWISSNEFTFDVTSLAVDGNYDVIVSTASGSETFVDAIRVVLSAWIDLRLGGASLTDGTTVGSDIRYRTNMSMNRDAQGMSFSGLSPWASWVKFDSLGWTRGSGTTLEWIFTSPVAAMMIGIGSDATNETNNSQFSQAESMAYFQNASTFWGLFGNNGTVGVSGNNNNSVSIATGDTFKAVFTDDGGRGGTFTLYQLPSADPTDWDDLSTILTTFTIAGTLNPDEPNLVPFIIPRNGDAQRFIALKVT